MRWLRLYDDTINDPKILKLPEAMRWHWIAMLCIASKNGGSLPALDDIAIQLRVTAAKATEIIAALVKAGLLDKTETGFAPHNWNGRQYKTDTADPTAASRAKRYRDRKRDDRDATVTRERPEAEQITEQIDDAGDAREPLVSKSANSLAEQLLVIAGHDPKFWPPGWCGAPMRVQSWLSSGWEPEIITAAVRGAAAKKRGAPAASVQFFENAIAEEVARQAAPLPTVEVREAEKLTVNHAKPKNGIIQAADDLRRKLASFDGPAREPDELRGGASGAPARLLSHRSG